MSPSMTVPGMVYSPLRNCDALTVVSLQLFSCSPSRLRPWRITSFEKRKPGAGTAFTPSGLPHTAVLPVTGVPSESNMSPLRPPPSSSTPRLRATRSPGAYVLALALPLVVKNGCASLLSTMSSIYTAKSAVRLCGDEASGTTSRLRMVMPLAPDTANTASFHWLATSGCEAVLQNCSVSGDWLGRSSRLPRPMSIAGPALGE